MKPNDKAIEAARAAILKAMAERNCIIKGVPFNENNVDEFDAGEAIEHAKVALDAAYAAQFQSEEYAGLVKWLRDKAESLSEIYPPEAEAADALEALLAALAGWKGRKEATAALLKQAEAERDAFAARLAPVEPIESDKDDPTREYIPLPGGWEIQTKGKGSSYRLLDKKTGERHMILAGDSLFVQEFVTRMAKEINASAQVQPVTPVEDEALVEIARQAILKETDECVGIWPTILVVVIAAIRPHIEAMERERCAKIAEGFPSNRDWVPGSLWGNIRNEIAAAIRSGK